MTRTSSSLTRRLFLAAAISLTALTAAAPATLAGSVVEVRETITDVKYRSTKIQGVNIAYREAGNRSRPTIVLLHGFPTSSHMFRELLPKLAARYHVIAPDYPGYGASDQPALAKFDYSFANFATVIDTLLQTKKIERYALYVMDYGAPVGFRLFAKHPERVTGFVVQNGNAYDEGLKAFWDPLKVFWKAPTTENGDKLRPFFELEATKWQWTHGVPKDKVHLISPDNWTHDQALLDRPGNKDIQLEMFKSYGTNVGEYPKWQALFREHQPPALVVWGKNDHIFPVDGAHPYERDLKQVEKPILNTGHFALETHLEFISGNILKFLDRTAGS
ncbi:MAG: alpha/beta fold hydrolase [Alphaproteobacteria bacterium]|nr:alpha/beta fold hydrolase [Alphaproteobacteria bacterium]